MYFLKIYFKDGVQVLRFNKIEDLHKTELLCLLLNIKYEDITSYNTFPIPF